MTPLNIIRAWKDAEYRHSLSEAEQALLPGHPASTVELTDTDLDSLAGAHGRYLLGTCLAGRRAKKARKTATVNSSDT
jgi:mersacidin/lichenicidin family type 2 lantibiotic